MTRWPTTFERYVDSTPITLVAIAIAMSPSTSLFRQAWSPAGSAMKTSRIRNGVIAESPADTRIRVRTALRRRRYGRKSAKTRRRLALRTAGSAGRSTGSFPANVRERPPGFCLVLIDRRQPRGVVLRRARIRSPGAAVRPLGARLRHACRDGAGERRSVGRDRLLDRRRLPR